MKIDDDDVCEISEEAYRRDKFDKEFNIGLISECEDDESIVKTKKKVAVMIRIKVYWCLLLYYITMVQK